jgi:hypothetical protein
MSSLHTLYRLHTRFDPDASGPDSIAPVGKTHTHLMKRPHVLEVAREAHRSPELGRGCLGGGASPDEMHMLDMT